ncbi:hypothetical protein KVM32_06100 [Helicobacter pylori]|uniref:hypothetical protein n=1 Tax=Helicobacter pylori TaxID=210 RepID=UPI0002BB02EF|nr:hypothetical protein [Helicobacter pylori]NID07349.1 hypothetical protein [Helicobacter pylori]WQT10182.1 hypothetical protein E5D82_06200 [Helicobacter pylori]WQT11608.1 hypothetical protein E5A83_06195 [Helicobacter pylori]WQT63535.1 hypothetical protein E5D93_06200 [Helicobacter pylori]WQW16211.1 hypothetical protein KVM68_06100 [Helicobacter pylori]
MNTNNKNKNASHLTHEMKNKHGDLAEASKRANEQPILEIIREEIKAVIHAKDKINNAKDKRIHAQKTIIKARDEEIQAMEEEKQAREEEIQAIERLRELEHRLENMRQLPNDNDTIDIEPEDEKD